MVKQFGNHQRKEEKEKENLFKHFVTMLKQIEIAT